NGIDISPFEISKSKSDIRKELGLPLEDLLGIYLARFTSPKNHLFLIKVLKEVNDFKIILGGDGEMRDKFLEEVKANRLEDRVIYKGYIKNNLVPLYLLASDFCIFPSKVEGFSNAILEAMVAGLTVIIFENIYSKEYGPHLLVAKSEDEFIEYVKNFVSDKNLREKLGKLNKEYVKNNLDIKVIARQLIPVLS
ncbi:MAG: glycosyltransferase family 4 protein, partial [Candidatus Aenigmatarchaeota archaeon]